MKDNTPLWIEVSRSAILHNLEVFKDLVGPNVKLAPCIKSNAYGHGLIEVGQICQDSDLVDYACVTTLKEANTLKNEANFAKPILVLGPLLTTEREECIANGFEFFVNSETELEETITLSSDLKVVTKIHIKVDTGMHRMGFVPSDVPAILGKIKSSSVLEIVGFATHYATSDEPENPGFFEVQKECFARLLESIELPEQVIIHTANSAASLIAPETYYDMIRPGVSLYGACPSPTVKEVCYNRGINLQPVLKLKTKIGLIKNVEKGEYIGYGGFYTAPNDMTIAILPVGYYDGLDRRMSSRVDFEIGEKKARITGRVCMNITMIDISGLGNVSLGDEVIIMGNLNTSEELAIICETIPHEILTHLRYTIPKIVVE